MLIAIAGTKINANFIDDLQISGPLYQGGLVLAQAGYPLDSANPYIRFGVVAEERDPMPVAMRFQPVVTQPTICVHEAAWFHEKGVGWDERRQANNLTERATFCGASGVSKGSGRREEGARDLQRRAARGRHARAQTGVEAAVPGLAESGRNAEQIRGPPPAEGEKWMSQEPKMPNPGCDSFSAF